VSGSTQQAPIGAALHAALEAAQAEGLEPNVRRWLRLQGATAGEWVEAQALNVPDGKWTSNRFAHAADSATLVRLLGQADTWGAPGIYVIANRINPAVTTRRPPGTWHVAQKGEGTSDRDIRARAVFYVDVDVERPKGTSATDAQVLLAHERAVEIYGALGGALGGTDALGFGHSGNGRAIFVALDFLPETAELRATVGGLLAALRARFQGGGILIDVTVADAKRLVPAFGTMKRKGAPGIAEYPHRRTAILAPEHVRRIGFDELTQLLTGMRAGLDDEQQRTVDTAMGVRAAPAAPAARPPRPAPSRGGGDGRASAFDLAKQVPIEEVLSWLGLMDGANPVCCGCGLTGDSSVAIVGNGLKCSHERCSQFGAPGCPGFRTTIDVVMEAREVDAVEAVKLLAAQFGPAAPAPVREAPESAPSGVPAEALDRVAANIVRALASAPAPVRSKRELFALVKGRKETFLAVVDHLVATGRLDIVRGAFRLPKRGDGTAEVVPEGGNGTSDVVRGTTESGSRTRMEPPEPVPGTAGGGSRTRMEPPEPVPGPGSRTRPDPDMELDEESGTHPNLGTAPHDQGEADAGGGAGNVLYLVPPHREPVRPKIQVTAGELHHAIDNGIRALRADPDLYHREHALTHVTRATLDDSAQDPGVVAGSPQIHVIAIETLRERLTRYAIWESFDSRSEEWVRRNPSDAIVRGIAARKQWPGIRRIVGVLETPSLRPDGTLLDVPGYDAATGYLYQPAGTFPPIPAEPTPHEARAALAVLQDVFIDFPYEKEAGRSMAVAAILTLLARPAIRGGTPAFLFNSNTPGSGKTLQADVAALISLGREAGRKTFPTDKRNYDEELEKILGGYALQGARLINFDNISGEIGFGGSALESRITAEDTSDFRLLGTSRLITLPWRTVIFGSGNNITVNRDSLRRVMLSRIDSPYEKPELRPHSDFIHPERAFQLKPWVRRNRPRLVAAGLTLLRGFVCAGRPQLERTWSGAEAWTALIADALVWAGAPDPLLCRPGDEDDANPEKRAMEIMLRFWPRLDPQGTGITIKSAIALLYPADRLRGDALPPDGFDDMRDAIEQLVPVKPRQAPDPAALGHAFRRYKRSNLGGLMLVVTRSDRDHVQRWAVVPAHAGRGPSQTGSDPTDV
jgi:hypothetical protein